MARSPTVARGTELRGVEHDRGRREGPSDSPCEFSEVQPALYSGPVRKAAVLRAHPESHGENPVSQPHGGHSLKAALPAPQIPVFT